MRGKRNLVEQVVTAIDDAVPLEPSTANRVLEDTSRAMTWLGALFAVASVLLVPWVFYIGFSLPERQTSAHYDAAWAGFDAFLFLALAATAYAVLRRARWMATSAGAAAALLVTDAWFDVVTSPSTGELVEALLEAALVELPLALACLWVCAHATRMTRRRFRMLAHRDAHALPPDDT